MAWTPTAYHARNLFILTVEGRFGPNWRRTTSGETVARVATEVAQGFGGEPRDREAALGLTAQCLWALPDGSRIYTGPMGVTMPADARPAEVA